MQGLTRSSGSPRAPPSHGPVVTPGSGRGLGCPAALGSGPWPYHPRSTSARLQGLEFDFIFAKVTLPTALPWGGHSSHSVALAGGSRSRFPAILSSSWQTFLKAYYTFLGSGLGGLTSLCVNSDSASNQLGDPGPFTSPWATVSSPVNGGDSDRSVAWACL